jgi:RND family efflux transporter MFP subunit
LVVLGSSPSAHTESYMPAVKSFVKKLLASLRRKWKLLVLLAIVIAGIGLWRYKAAQASKPTYEFEHPAYRDIEKTLEVSGVIDAKEKASMRFTVGGKVVYLGAKEGDLVRKWQTIATIDQRELQKRLKQDLNSYMQERITRDENLDHDSLKSFPEAQDRDQERSLSQQQLDLESSVLDVEIRSIAIQSTVLSSPFDGILVQSPTNVSGVNLLATDTFEVVNPETLVFRAAVDEADIGLISLGQQGTINLDSHPDEDVSTTVSYIDVKSSQSSSGTVFVVELPLMHDPELRKYKLGMNGDVRILLDHRDQALTIPLAATRERDDKMFVDVKIGENTVEEREITPGLETDDYVEVLNGLTTDDEIVIPSN